MTGSMKLQFKEWIILAKALKSVYARDNFLPDEESVKVWYEMLKDLSYQHVNVAVQKYMSTQKFPPTISEIRSIVAELVDGRIEDWSEEWKLVIHAMRGYSPGSNREYNFNDITAEVVKRLGGVEYMSRAHSYTEQDVLRANFRDIYKDLAKRKDEKRQMPLILQRTVSNMIGNEDPKQLPPSPYSIESINLNTEDTEEERTKITDEQIENFVATYGFNPLGDKEREPLSPEKKTELAQQFGIGQEILSRANDAWTNAMEGRRK